MGNTYECTLATRKGPVTFWARAGGYLRVDLGHGGTQACEGGHVNSGAAVSVGGEYTDLSDADFVKICKLWMRARARRMVRS